MKGGSRRPSSFTASVSRYFLACGPLNWLAALAVLSAVSVPITEEPLSEQERHVGSRIRHLVKRRAA